MTKPFRCKIGMHRWYRDYALVHSVRRCNYCPAVDDAEQAQELAAERARVSALPPGASFSQIHLAALGLPLDTPVYTKPSTER